MSAGSSAPANGSVSSPAVFRRSWTKRYPYAVRGEGVRIVDATGRSHLDAVSGVFVSNLGHGVGRIADRMAEQARAIAFPYSGSFATAAEDELAERVLAIAPPGFVKAFFVSGGSEANEVAIKISRKYQLASGRPERWQIVGREHSYHGATMTALSVGSHPARQADYLPYLTTMPHLPAPLCRSCRRREPHEGCDLSSAHRLGELCSTGDAPAAVIAEPIVGAALGAVVPPPGYYDVIRRVCDDHDVVFIADEVITGVGRTGFPFAMDGFDVVPDLITCGKGLSAGYAPLGAVLVHERIVEALEREFDSLFTGYTYSGNPVSCAAGAEVLACVDELQLVERAASNGAWLQARLGELARRQPLLFEARGRGMLWGLELVPPAEGGASSAELVRLSSERGMLLSDGHWIDAGVRREHVMFAPPLVSTEAELDEMVTILDDAVSALGRAP